MKRFDSRNIFYHLIMDLSYVFLAGLFFMDMIFEENEAGEIVRFKSEFLPLFIGILVLVYIAFIVYQILFIKYSGYQFTENEIICKKGVFFRKISRLEYKKIHAVNMRKNILQSIFKIAVITVDSGATGAAHKAEITIIENSGVARKLMDSICALKNGASVTDEFKEEGKEETLPESLYKFTSAKKFLYSFVNLLNALFVIICVGIVIALLFGAVVILKSRIMSSPENFDTLGILFIGLVVFGISAVAISLLSFVFSVIASFVEYYNFNIRKSNDSIKISYGLFVRHENSFNYSKIKGVKIRQGIIKRIFGFASINLEVIGYTRPSSNDEKDVETGVLVPFCKMSEVDEILGKILPDYIPSEKESKAKSFFPFVSWFLLIYGIVAAAVSLLAFSLLYELSASAKVFCLVALGIGFVSFVIIAIKTVSAVLCYKTASVSLKEGKITVYSGGFVKQITVFNRKNLIAVERVTTPCRQKAGINSYVLHVKTNELTNEAYLLIHDSELMEGLCNELKY